MRNFGYLGKLLRYAFSRNPLLYVYAILGFASVGTEVLAVSSLFPIAAIANKQTLPQVGLMASSLAWLGMSATLRTFILIFLALSLLRVITHVCSQAIGAWSGKRVQAQLSSDGFSSVLRFHTIKEIEQKSAGYFIGIIGDESSRASVIVLTAVQLFTGVLLAGLYFLAIVRFSPRTAFAIVAFLVLNAIVLLQFFRVNHRLGARTVEQSRAVNSAFVDALNGMRSVRVYRAEDYVAENYRRQIFTYVRTLFLVDVMPLISSGVPVVLLLGLCALATALAPASTWATFDAAFAITIIAFLMRLFPTIGQCLTSLLKVISDLRVAKDITAILPESKSSVASPAESLDEHVGRIALSQVGFSYDGTTWVLDGLDLAFEAGRSYAIVGPSGVGKSTLLDLLLKFHDPQRGQILVNEQDLLLVADKHLRQRVILVGQTTTVFNDTIANNLRYGAELSEETLARAARLAHADEFIRATPQGYETVLSYQGTNLSGGQRQRIGLARALARDPDVLILDEVTSALDSETRERVVGEILREYASRIVIFVTHDNYIRERVSDVVELGVRRTSATTPST